MLKCDGLKKIQIGKSAGKLRKGETSTTIPPEGSTLQAIGNGSG